MVCGDAQPGGSPAQNLLDHPSGNRIRRATKSARQIGGALGNLVLPVGRIHGRNPVAVSRSWRRHALTACHGNDGAHRSEEHTSELQSLTNLVCRLLLEKKKKNKTKPTPTNT